MIDLMKSTKILATIAIVSLLGTMITLSTTIYVSIAAAAAAGKSQSTCGLQTQSDAIHDFGGRTAGGLISEAAKSINLGKFEVLMLQIVVTTKIMLL